jgi:hypothetical protein
MIGSVTRTCSKCGKSKLAIYENFAPDWRRPDCCQSRCRVCSNAIALQKSGGKTREEHRARWFAATLVCNKCKVEHPNTPDFFHKNPRFPDQPYPICITCRRKYARLPEVKERVNEKNRTSGTAKKRRAEAIKRWRQRNRLQEKCYQRVRNSIRSGELKRQPCERCGAEKAEAHHHKGYEQEYWLDVVWLCKGCHVEEHHAA